MAKHRKCNVIFRLPHLGTKAWWRIYRTLQMFTLTFLLSFSFLFFLDCMKLNKCFYSSCFVGVNVMFKKNKLHFWAFEEKHGKSHSTKHTLNYISDSHHHYISCKTPIVGPPVASIIHLQPPRAFGFNQATHSFLWWTS